VVAPAFAERHQVVDDAAGLFERAYRTKQAAKFGVRVIAMLLLKFLLLKSTWAWSLSNLAAMLRFNLLSYRDLWAWLNAPFEISIVVPDGEQMALFE
jgi:hypothetical protein